MPAPVGDPFALRLLDQLVRLRMAGALDLRETAPGRGVHRFVFRVGGQRVSIDLDSTVCEIRCYHHRDEIGMARVPEKTMDMLIGRTPAPQGAKPSQDEVVAEMRNVVTDWKRRNPRLFMQPPCKVGHPDNWNAS